MSQSKTAIDDLALLEGPIGRIRSTVESRIGLRLKDGGNTREFARRALEYAAEAEQRIADLGARIELLESIAETDELTGLLNRRGFDNVLRRNLASAARYGETGVLAYIDLDEFKSVNDRHGHPTGDEFLKRIGRFLKRNIRATDFAARLGGDEFVVLFVRADHAKARDRARTLVAKLNKLTISIKGKAFRPRASLGLASYDETTDPTELVERADRAMYKTKGTRRTAHLKTLRGGKACARA